MQACHRVIITKHAHVGINKEETRLAAKVYITSKKKYCTANVVLNANKKIQGNTVCSYVTDVDRQKKVSLVVNVFLIVLRKGQRMEGLTENSTDWSKVCVERTPLFYLSLKLQTMGALAFEQSARLKRLLL